MRKYLIIFAWKLKGLDVNNLFLKLQKKESWSKQQWQDHQNRLFLDFVEFCYNESPYYKELFDTNNLKLKDIKSIEDIALIPILTKDMVRENLDKLMVQKNVNKNFTVHTTGSTGTPLTFFGSKERSEHIVAGLWRLYARCGWKPGEQIATIWGFQKNMPNWKLRLRDYFSGTTHLNAWKANDSDFEKWFKILKKKNVRIIMCYGSSGSRFANWILENNHKYNGLKGVFSTSEKLYEQQKLLMEEAFNCPIFDMYGCGEAIHLACSCKNGNMHLTTDMSIIEEGPVNDDGQTSLIVTGFTNRTVPFLRYQNGDSGTLSKEQCNCGLNTPLMELKVSRLSDVFRFSDGKKYPSLYFVLRLYKEGFDGVELFQFHQDKIDHIFLRVVKNKKFTNQTHDNLIKAIAEICIHINHKAIVELSYDDHIEQSSTSKHYYAKSDIK